MIIERDNRQQDWKARILPSTYLRLGQISPKLNHSVSSHGDRILGLDLSLQKLIEFLLQFTISSISWTSKTQHTCWRKIATSNSTPSLLMGVYLQLPQMVAVLSISGNMLLVFIHIGGNSQLGTQVPILFSPFNFHQPHHQSWAVSIIFFKCTIWMAPSTATLPSSMRSFLPVVLT